MAPEMVIEGPPLLASRRVVLITREREREGTGSSAPTMRKLFSAVPNDDAHMARSSAPVGVFGGPVFAGVEVADSGVKVTGPDGPASLEVDPSYIGEITIPARQDAVNFAPRTAFLSPVRVIAALVNVQGVASQKRRHWQACDTPTSPPAITKLLAGDDRQCSTERLPPTHPHIQARERIWWGR